MSNVLSRGVMPTAALVCLLAAQLQGRADHRQPDKLTLQSGYSRSVLVDWARQVSLSVVLDEKEGGSGTLTFDPNIHDEWGSTCIAIQDIPVRVRLVQDDGRAAKGRRLYELKPVGEEGRVSEGGEHWFLVRPEKAGLPCWLVFADKGGKFGDVLMLE